MPEAEYIPREGTLEKREAPEVKKENAEHVDSGFSLENYNEFLQIQTHVSQEVVDGYTEPREFVVGTAQVKNRRGETVPVGIEYAEDGPNFKFLLVHPATGALLGEVTGEVYGRSDQIKTNAVQKNEYPGFDSQGQWPKVYLDEMKNETAGGYAGVGTVLHRLVVEHSFRVGAMGRVQAKAGAIISGHTPTSHDRITSAGFHEQFGFNFQDVKDEQGGMVTTGQSVHEDLAVRRLSAMQRARKMAASRPDGAEKDALIMQMYNQSRVEYPYDKEMPMYLPTHIIHREWERVRQNPYVSESLATVRALLQKKTTLEEIQRIREQLGTSPSAASYDQEKLARAYVRLNNIPAAQQAFSEALRLEEEFWGPDRSQWSDAEAQRYDQLKRDRDRL